MVVSFFNSRQHLMHSAHTEPNLAKSTRVRLGVAEVGAGYVLEDV
jgi:hypothetical protein